MRSLVLGALAAASAFLASACATSRCDNVAEEVAVSPAIRIAPGYRAARVLEGLDHPKRLAFDDDGHLYVLTKDRVRIFDGTFREIAGFDVGEAEPRGLLVLDRGRTVWVASRGLIQRFRGDAQLAYTQPETIVDGLPNGLYANNNLKLGPDQKIYFGLGATCDVCDEDDERSAAILRFDPSGTGRATPEIYARGVRNASDLIFTAHGELLATENGPDCCSGDTDECPVPAPDRLLSVHADDHFGFPYIYRRQHDGAGMAITPALAELGRFAGASALVEYQGDALCEDRGQLFVALWGLQHGTDEGGRKVVRVRVLRDGTGAITGAAIEPFLGIDGLGHPIAIAVSPIGGRMYVLDALGFVLEIASDRCP